jgi:CelD/BcsL family acetyltransferase involved in cellulose biosynthesis
VTRQRWRIEVVTQPERLAAIEGAWRELFQQDLGATPFQSPDWLLPWAECFAARGSLRVIVLWDGTRALLCLPLLLVERGGQRTLSWLGAGLSDYLDVLASPGAGSDALAAALAVARELATEADRIELADVPANSSLLSTRAPGLQVAPGSICPRLQPGGDLAAYERRLPAWLARNLQRSERRLRARGRTHWRSAESGGAPELLEAFFELHAARWQARGTPGVLDHSSVRAFHHRAAARLLARGLLALDVLFLGDRPVAAGYAFVRSRAYLYLTGFDPSLQGVSLGSLVIWQAIRRALQERREAVDFLRGQEPYKYAWGATDTQTYQLVLSPTALQSGSANDQAARGATGSASPSNCCRTSSA